jgi:PAS domain-containing protein
MTRKKKAHNGRGRAPSRRKSLHSVTYDLKERVKELNCLYSISSIVEKRAVSLDEILRGTVDVIPRAWQYPEITCGRILLDECCYATDNFRETPWHQSQPIMIGGRKKGLLQICYLEERPVRDEGPFLNEERSLIKVIAERIGGIIERKQAEEALKESEAQKRALLSAIPDLMFQLDNDGNLVGFHEGKFVEHRAFLARLQGRNVSFLHERDLLPKRLVEQGMVYVKRAFATGKPQIFEQHLMFGGEACDFEVRIVVSRPREVLGIVRDITLRKRLEREILEISGREQRRIGQDLHDGLCQHLAGIGFMAKVRERRVAAGGTADPVHAAEMVQLIDEAITMTRASRGA